MKKLLFIAAAFVAFALSLSAQTVKGDMNGDGQLTVADLSNTASRILESAPLEYISTGGNPYQTDNSLILGKWYRTKKSWLEFKADGTIESHADGGSYTNELYDVLDTINVSNKSYIFMPYQGRVLFCNKNGIPESFTNIYQITDEYIVMGTGKRMAPLYKSQPITLVNSITLSETKVTLAPDESVRIKATVLPADADDTSVTWLSDNTDVATVMGGIILAIGEGTANIICKSNDGSNIAASCVITVNSAVSDDYHNPSSAPIGFSYQISSMTRASLPAIQSRHYEFGVFALTDKESSVGNNVIMDDYLVAYTDGTADGINKWYKWYQGWQNHSTASWFYEGIGSVAHATYTVPQYTQVLKYWDDSKDQYNFYAFMPYSKITADATYNADKIEYSAASTLKFTKLSTFYTNPLTQVATVACKADGASFKNYTEDEEILNDNEALYAYKNVSKSEYGQTVPLSFKHINSKVLIKFYEDISGYDVELIDLRPEGIVTGYAANDAELYAGIAFSPATATQAAIPSSVAQPTDLPTYTDYADVTVSALSSTPVIAYSNEHKVNDNLRFKIPTVGTKIGTSRANATLSPTIYYPFKKVSTGDYTDDCGYTLHVSYKLTSTTGEQIYVYDARVHVSKEYTRWEEGKAYTYIFKIPGLSNGATDPKMVDPATISGIQEPWIDPADPRVPDDPSLQPIVFDGVVITDYDDVGEWYR